MIDHIFHKRVKFRNYNFNNYSKRLSFRIYIILQRNSSNPKILILIKIYGYVDNRLYRKQFFC